MADAPPPAPRRSAPMPWWAHVLPLAWGPALVGGGVLADALGRDEPWTLAGMAVTMSGFAWLAARSLTRHLAAAAAQPDQAYFVRHRGLVFAALMWSTMVGVAVRRAIEEEDGRGDAFLLFRCLMLATLHAPLWLWAGGMWQRSYDATMDRLSRRDEDKKKDDR